MELWIRSQKKTRLVLAKDLMICGFSDGSIGIRANNECFIGEYKTRERALEVLDEIQKIVGWIQKDMKYTTIGEVNHLIGCYDNYVYEMPKE